MTEQKKLVETLKNKIKKEISEWKNLEPMDKDFFEGKEINETKYVRIYALDPQIRTFNNPLSLSMGKIINEGLIKTYPIATTIKYIREYFKLEDWQVLCSPHLNGIDLIQVKIPNIKSNINDIKKAFNLCGWHLNYEEGLNDNQWVLMLFEAKFKRQVTFDSDSFLIHVSPKYNKENILKIGLCPKFKNKLFQYPERIYFIVPSKIDRKDIWELGEELCKYNQSEGNDGNYVAFKIDLDKLPTDIKFYPDPTYFGGVYTTDNVPPTAITGYFNIKFKQK